VADLNIMPFYTGDYLADTTHLSTEEHGAYCLLLIAMWRAGGRLSADPAFLQRVAKASPKHWPRLWSVVGKFFTEADGFIVQKKLGEVFRSAAARKEKSRTNGMKGGRPRAGANSLKNNDAAKAAGYAQVRVSESKGEPDEKLSMNLKVKESKPQLGSQSRSARAREAGAAAVADEHENRGRDFDQIERACRQAAGLDNDPSPGLLNLSPIIGLIDAGYDLQTDIVPAIRSVTRSGRKGRTWAYYVPPIIAAKEQHDGARNAGTNGASAAQREETAQERHERWRRMWDAWKRGTWPYGWGPDPKSAGCEIPRELIEQWSQQP